MGLRHGLRFFLYVSLATGLVGCCNCDEGPPPDYPRRPGDIVRELREAIQEMLDCDGPFVLDVIVPYTEHVLPMIPAGKTVKDMLLK